MNKSFKQQALLGLVKQFIPDIKDKAAPLIENILADVIRKSEDELRINESYVCLNIVQRQSKIYVCVCTMSEDNQWQRTLEQYNLEQLISIGVDKFMKNN